MKSASRYLVLIALVAISSVVVFMLCRVKNEAAKAASSAQSYEERKSQFDVAMKERREERLALARKREKINEELKKMVDAARAELGAKATDEEVKKHLEKNPEWVSLYKKAEDLGRALADARGKTMKVMREYKDVATAQPSQKSDLK
jgi:hypothetical protein